METTYRIKASDLNKGFLDSIKILFKKKEIEISITDEINDETNFLLTNPTNKAHLFEAIEELKHGKNLVRFSGDEFEKYTQELLKK